LPGRQAWRFVSASWQYNTQSLAIDDERFADLFPSQSFTLQMVYYYDQIYDTSENTILMSINALDSVATSSYNHFLCVIRHNSDDINMVWRNDDYLYNAQSTPNFNIGEWNHFAVTYDVISDRSASVTTYMNGEPGSTQTKDRMNSGSLIQSMCLGRFRPYPQSGSFWGSNPGGALDTIKINKGILTSEQIYEEYRRSIAYPVSASFNTIKGVSDHGLLF
ncbi:MAG: hypothetical protein GWN56_14160, partial [Nitrosopumilaceae archaeon]|nr:hypothetical protein [Nitrosopumilaceae archaeon]